MMIRRARSVGIPSRLAILAAGMCLFASGFAGGCDKSTSDRNIHTITVSEVRTMREKAGKKGRALDVLMVDPRAPEDFAAGHIPGARNVRLGDVPIGSAPRESLAKFETLVVYGEHAGSATAKAMTKRLISVGYGQVRWMVGGLAEWTESGGEVEATPK